MALFYYVPTNPFSVQSQLTQMLVNHQPYTQDFLPYNPRGYYKLVWKKVTKDEWQVVQNRNRDNDDVFREKLLNIGANPEFIYEVSSVPEDVPVVQDMVWRVIRQELGISEERKGVWLPAIRAWSRGTDLKKVVSNPKLDRVLIDGKWDKVLFKADGEVSESYLEHFDRFQEIILKV
jgi:hypothetical protein